MAIETSEFVVRYQCFLRTFPDGSREAYLASNPLLVGPTEKPGDFRSVPFPPALEAKNAEQNLQRAARRAKAHVRWACRAIGADHMLTFTYRENMTDRARLCSDWRRLRARLQRAFPGFRYVCVPELQKRGAFHLHVAVAGRYDVRTILRHWRAVVGDFEGKSGGAVNVRGPSAGAGAAWNRSKLSSYLSKYIGKSLLDDDAVAGKRSYFVSKGIEMPAREVLWIEASDGVDALRQTYFLVTGGAVLGVSHAVFSGGAYWCTADDPPQTRLELV